MPQSNRLRHKNDYSQQSQPCNCLNSFIIFFTIPVFWGSVETTSNLKPFSVSSKWCSFPHGHLQFSVFIIFLLLLFYNTETIEQISKNFSSWVYLLSVSLYFILRNFLFPLEVPDLHYTQNIDHLYCIQ